MPDTGLGITALHQLSALVGYLLGSIPFGLLLTRLAGKGDIRAIGSGNIGATNVLRTGDKKLAAATLLLDGGKGAIAVIIMGLWGADHALLAGLFAVVGHNFPVWLHFRGGKGVATTLGVLLALSWPVGLIACAIWLAMAVIFRYSSLAALVALVISPFVMVWLVDQKHGVVAALLAVLGVIRHHANITRLIRGEEPRIGGRH
ncbi:MAG: glycerol-3-phosphate 1-O-acyltransferase PlsY [Rhodospirillales bacterium]|nr:glycerol-3-phosphate 1-O-acyltransferase PlsY [Rhodospirillales bacterium]